MSSGILTLSDFCEQNGFPFELRNALIDELNNRQRASEAATEARCNARAHAPDRAPLLDENGQSWGHVEATLDARALFSFIAKEGPEIAEDPSFLDHYLRRNAYARVRTVPARCTVRHPGLTFATRGHIRETIRYG
jgi:hypothetical protein